MLVPAAAYIFRIIRVIFIEFSKHLNWFRLNEFGTQISKIIFPIMFMGRRLISSIPLSYEIFFHVRESLYSLVLSISLLIYSGEKPTKIIQKTILL